MAHMIDLHRRLSIAVCAATCIGAASTRAPPWPEGFSVVTIEGKRMYKVLRAGPTLGKDRKLLGIGILYAATSTDWTALKMAAVDGYVQPDREAEAKARETVDRWLSLLDGGNLERAWEDRGRPAPRSLNHRAAPTPLLA